MKKVLRVGKEKRPKIHTYYLKMPFSEYLGFGLIN